jgi:hypothetical protein
LIDPFSVFPSHLKIGIIHLSKFPLPLFSKGGGKKNVMLNLFQHLIESTTYETLE